MRRASVADARARRRHSAEGAPRGGGAAPRGAPGAPRRKRARIAAEGSV